MCGSPLTLLHLRDITTSADKQAQTSQWPEMVRHTERLYAGLIYSSTASPDTL